MSTPPNILLIMSDQHRADVLSAEGRTDLETPHLDALAQRGAHFTRAYCNNAICGASRCSLQTGILPRTLGVATFEPITYRGRLIPLQACMQQHGYATGGFGKRHLDTPADSGWNTTATTLQKEASSQPNWWSWIDGLGLREAADRDWQSEHGKSNADPMACQISALPDHATMEAWTADRTADFIRASTDAGRPFFAQSSFYRPHQPYTPTRSWYDRIDPSRIEMPASLTQPVNQLPSWLRDIRGRESKPWCCGRAAREPELYRFYIHCYLALVAEIDHHVGRLLELLDELGIADNTIVVYTADHGDFVGAHGMIEKAAIGHNVYEDTLRVPLIIHAPGQTISGVRDDLVELVDLYPTLCDLAGVPHPDAQPLQGRSLAGCIRDRNPLGREFVISENGSQTTVIEPRYKLGQWAEPLNPAWDLRHNDDLCFDREADPLETTNLIADASCQEHLSRLRGYIDRFYKATPGAAWEALRARLHAG
ncbi:MAG: sulfatase-like hydrolase/transferase [Planctomycetota bacterium]